MKKKFNFLIIFIMVGCGFTTGLYEDILKAQDHVKKYKFQDAYTIYSEILKKKPSQKIQIKINYQLGELASIYLNKAQKSIAYYEKVITISSDPLWKVKALERIADIYFVNLKKYSFAKESYKKLIEFQPKLNKHYFYMNRYADSLNKIGKTEESISVFKQIISEKSPESLTAYYQLGLINFHNRKYKEANNFWFEYLKRENDKSKIANVKFLIANSYESDEQLKKAYNIYYSLIGTYPNTKVLKNRLESLYKRRVDRKR